MSATRVEVVEIAEYKKVNPVLDIEGRRRIKVGSRYAVVVMVCEGMVSDGMWVRLEHAARFLDKEQAERLAARVLASVRNPLPGTWGGLDLSNWIWSPGPTNAFSDLQKAPTATPYNVG